MNDQALLCPCFSKLPYANCCQTYHEGRPPLNALALMRSRYAAYALNRPDYLIKTTHPGNAQYTENLFGWRRRLSQLSQVTNFTNLEILDFKEKDQLASVIFKATLFKNGQDASFTEESLFEQIGSHWLYLNGKMYPTNSTPPIKKSFKVLPLAYYGDPILRKKADLISEINQDTLNLIEEMIDTMDAYNGIGIAAPQVKQSLKLFIIKKPELINGDLHFGEIQVFINPKLSSPSAGFEKTSEGCLSIPSLRKEVERPLEITVDYTDLQGNQIQEKFSGFHARMIMHENDHLNGVLFVDRLNAEERKEITPFLLNLEKRLKKFSMLE